MFVYILYDHTDLSTLSEWLNIRILMAPVCTDSDKINLSRKVEHTCFRCAIFALQITMVPPSKVYTVVCRSDTEVVGSNPSWAWMYIFFCGCVDRSLATGRSLIQGVIADVSNMVPENGRPWTALVCSAIKEAHCCFVHCSGRLFTYYSYAHIFCCKAHCMDSRVFFVR
jgi:hypothetical protein